jgi:CHAT domain-containing protein
MGDRRPDGWRDPGVRIVRAARAVLVAACAALASAPRAATAAPIPCSAADAAALRTNIAAHLRHTMLMDQKFRFETYGAGPLKTPEFATLEEVQAFLRAVAPRRAAVLYQVRNGSALCTWLVSGDGIVPHFRRVDAVAYGSLQERLLAALDVGARARSRAPARRGVEAAVTARRRADPEQVLREAGELLFPEPIAARLVDGQVDTLIVVPTGAVGALPFAALPVAGRPLVERAGILVAPGFGGFAGKPPVARRPLAPAIVVGNPRYPRDRDYVLPDLPGALREAQDVAAAVGARPVVGDEATIARVKELVAARPEPALLYLATHGLADPVNPLDGSVLWLSDGRWTAREVFHLRLGQGRPLVVLSACQTGLGKSFEVGTTGMARAWIMAGASSVVMSVWRVDDDATRALMTRFVEEASHAPADVALRRAMLHVRAADPDPARWASFAVYGLPERLAPDGAR